LAASSSGTLLIEDVFRDGGLKQKAGPRGNTNRPYIQEGDSRIRWCLAAVMTNKVGAGDVTLMWALIHDDSLLTPFWRLAMLYLTLG